MCLWDVAVEEGFGRPGIERTEGELCASTRIRAGAVGDGGGRGHEQGLRVSHVW